MLISIRRSFRVGFRNTIRNSSYLNDIKYQFLSSFSGVFVNNSDTERKKDNLIALSCAVCFDKIQQPIDVSEYKQQMRLCVCDLIKVSMIFYCQLNTAWKFVFYDCILYLIDKNSNVDKTAHTQGIQSK